MNGESWMTPRAGGEAADASSLFQTFWNQLSCPSEMGTAHVFSQPLQMWPVPGRDTTCFCLSTPPSICHFNKYILKTYCALGPLPGTRIQSQGDYMTSLSFRS